MFQKDWEKRWEKYGKALATNVHKQQEADWISDFLQSSILLSNLLMPSMIAFVTEFPMKLEKFDEERFIKKLNKAKKEQVQQVIKLFLMDYFVSFLEHPVHILILEEKALQKIEVEKRIATELAFTKEEKTIFEEIKQKKDTYYPTILLLRQLHLGKDANNQALVEGIELFKEQAYEQMDKNFQTFFMEQKKD